MTAILISIKPEFTKKIFDGTKRFEFRKSAPNPMPQIAFVYETAPTQRIVGCFIFKEIHQGSPNALWRKVRAKAGIAKDRFESYFENCSTAYAYEIHWKQRYFFPHKLEEIGFTTPPQSWCYVPDDIAKKCMGDSLALFSLAKSR
jgi:predicted transcriptional regulator